MLTSLAGMRFNGNQPPSGRWAMQFFGKEPDEPVQTPPGSEDPQPSFRFSCSPAKALWYLDFRQRQGSRIAFGAFWALSVSSRSRSQRDGNTKVFFRWKRVVPVVGSISGWHSTDKEFFWSRGLMYRTKYGRLCVVIFCSDMYFTRWVQIFTVMLREGYLYIGVRLGSWWTIAVVRAFQNC